MRCCECQNLIYLVFHPDFGVVKLSDIKNDKVEARIIGESDDLVLGCSMNCMKLERKTHNCCYFKEKVIKI